MRDILVPETDPIIDIARMHIQLQDKRQTKLTVLGALYGLSVLEDLTPGEVLVDLGTSHSFPSRLQWLDHILPELMEGLDDG